MCNAYIKTKSLLIGLHFILKPVMFYILFPCTKWLEHTRTYGREYKWYTAKCFQIEAPFRGI